MKITCHARYRARKGAFEGYVRIHDGAHVQTRSTGPANRLTRQDALADAAWLKTDLLQTHRYNGQPMEEPV